MNLSAVTRVEVVDQRPGHKAGRMLAVHDQAMIVAAVLHSDGRTLEIILSGSGLVPGELGSQAGQAGHVAGFLVPQQEVQVVAEQDR